MKAADIAKLIPWNKLRRYEIANLAFEFAALYFAVDWAKHTSNQVLGIFVILFVVLMGFCCVAWACKQ